MLNEDKQHQIIAHFDDKNKEYILHIANQHEVTFDEIAKMLKDGTLQGFLQQMIHVKKRPYQSFKNI